MRKGTMNAEQVCCAAISSPSLPPTSSSFPRALYSPFLPPTLHSPQPPLPHTPSFLPALDPPPLSSSQGKEEAEKTAKCLQGMLGAQGGELISSPMLRAIETAAPIAMALAVPCRITPLACEVGGMYEWRDGKYLPAAGLSAGQIRTRFPFCRTELLKQ
eukprot:9717-Hanusia_phi.AAC.1